MSLGRCGRKRLVDQADAFPQIVAGHAAGIDKSRGLMWSISLSALCCGDCVHNLNDPMLMASTTTYVLEAIGQSC